MRMLNRKKIGLPKKIGIEEDKPVLENASQFTRGEPNSETNEINESKESKESDPIPQKLGKPEPKPIKEFNTKEKEIIREVMGRCTKFNRFNLKRVDLFEYAVSKGNIDDRTINYMKLMRKLEAIIFVLGWGNFGQGIRGVQDRRSTEFDISVIRDLVGSRFQMAVRISYSHRVQ